MRSDRAIPISVGVILLAAIAAALLFTNLMARQGAGPTATFPTSVNGFEVIDVGAALDVGVRDDADDVAVRGWFQQSMPTGCAPPLGPTVPLFDDDCRVQLTWLLGEPERLIQIDLKAIGQSPPTGAALHPVFDGPGIGWARPLPQSGMSVPTPVVFIGHFDDPRAEGCRPEHLQLCRDRFVVTVVAWADGVENP
jgi:hypothetical protein